MTRVIDSDFGQRGDDARDLLGDDPLYPGEELTIENLSCGTYDLLIIDDTDSDRSAQSRRCT